MRMFDWMVRAYPRAFRARFGAGMRAALAQDYARVRARGRLPALRFVAASLVQTAWFSAAERLPDRAQLRAFLSSDVRGAARSLLAARATAATAVLSLALGIGANTALFSILNGLVFRPLPVASPERLVVLGRTDWTNPIWEQIRAREHDLFERAAAFAYQRFDLAPAGRTEPVGGGYVSGGFFQTMGIGTSEGRPLTPRDDVRGGSADGHAVVVSHRFAIKRFGATASALGRRMTLNRVPFTVVGVAPRGFLGPEVGHAMDVFVPLAAEAAIRGPQSALDGRTSWWLQIVARLKPGQTAEAAAAPLRALQPAIREATMPPGYSAEYRAGYLTAPADFTLFPAVTGVSPLRNRFETPLSAILVVVGAVLLIACANIANLMLARASARRHEMSVRLALGASRARLAGQLFVESVIVAAAGGLLGLLLARWGAALLLRQLGSDVDTVTLDVPLDWRVLGFTGGVAVLATIVFGVAPVAGLREVAPNDALKEHGRSAAGERQSGIRNALVVVQVALSFALVCGAALFGRTFTALATTPLGFDPDRLLIVAVDAAGATGGAPLDPAEALRLADAAAATPGVTRAALSFLTPLSGRNWTQRVQVAGGPTFPRPQQTAWVNAVAPGWFETYGMRVLAGRDVAAADTAGAAPVVVVNEAFVRRFTGDGSPIGKRVTGLGLGMLRESTIVGVVNDAVYRTTRLGVVPTMYLPAAQAPSNGPAFSLTVRYTTGRAAIEHALGASLSRAGPALVFGFRDYSEQVRGTLTQERLVAALSGFFGVLALLLAAVGVYGVTSFAIARRRPEIAVRIALGASSTGVVALVLRRIALLIGTGIALGAGLSLWSARFIESLLFRVDPRDPLTLAATGAILAAIGLLAGWLPARRASRLDPTAVLRS